MTTPSPAQRADLPRHLRVWKHNGFQGSVRMMQVNLRNMLDSDTLTPEARQVALRALSQAEYLAFLLKTRKDPAP